MRRFIYIIILATMCGMTAMAQNRPTGTHHSSGGDRGGFIIMLDRPELIYNDVNQIIEVYGNESDYYDFVITNDATQLICDAGQLDGNFAIINASYMVQHGGTYTIELTSSNHNVYHWTFDGDLKKGNFPDGIGRRADFDKMDNVIDRLLMPGLY